MKVEYNNLYTHLVFTTLHRLPWRIAPNLNQPEHHRKISYMEEYDAFIKFSKPKQLSIVALKIGENFERDYKWSNLHYGMAIVSNRKYKMSYLYD